MINYRNVKNTDVDLQKLSFFNTTAFKDFMTNLLNQDSLSSKAREDVIKKIEKLAGFYNELKDIAASNSIKNEKLVHFNALLSEHNIASISELKYFIDNELTGISNIINTKTNQLGVSIVDYFSSTDDEIRQRFEEITNSINQKLKNTETELHLLTTALSDSANFVESEIERKTEKLGNEIETMTNKLSPTSLAVIKPSFTKILKNLLAERSINKRNYKLAPKSLKSTYPTPKSYFRCLFEAYYEYNDAKQFAKDKPESNIQARIAKNRKTSENLQDYLVALQNKENLELGQSKQESNFALEILPTLNKITNIDASIEVTPKLDNVKDNKFTYDDLLKKVDTYFPNEVEKPTLKLVTPENNSVEKLNQLLKETNNKEEIITTDVENTNSQKDDILSDIIAASINDIINSSEKVVEDTKNTDTIESTTTTLENVLDEITSTEEITNKTLNDNNFDDALEIPSLMNKSSNTKTIGSSSLIEKASNAATISETLDALYLEDEITETPSLLNKTIETAKSIISDSNIASENSFSATTQDLTPKIEWEKTRIKTEQKLQKAHEKYEKITAKAQEQLERAKASAELEIKEIKGQALSLLKMAVDTANGIINDANIKSEEIIIEAESSSENVISIANKDSKQVLKDAEIKANELLAQATATIEKLKKESAEKCNSLLTSSEENANLIITTAKTEAEKLLTSSKAEADTLLNSIETKIQEVKKKILELKESIIDNEANIVSCEENQKALNQKIQKFEQLKAAALSIDGLDDELNSLTEKISALNNEIQSSKDSVVTLKSNILTSTENIQSLTASIPTIRPSLEKKANELLETSKAKAAKLLEQSTIDAQNTKDQAMKDIKVITEKTNTDIENISKNSKEEAEKLKENAKVKSVEIIKQANIKSKSILDDAQVKSKELKAEAKERASAIKATKKAELGFILTEEDFEKVC